MSPTPPSLLLPTHPAGHRARQRHARELLAGKRARSSASRLASAEHSACKRALLAVVGAGQCVRLWRLWAPGSAQGCGVHGMPGSVRAWGLFGHQAAHEVLPRVLPGCGWGKQQIPSQASPSHLVP
eukprot:353299-Chlamydomonas_euryale.AAC.23